MKLNHIEKTGEVSLSIEDVSLIIQGLARFDDSMDHRNLSISFKELFKQMTGRTYASREMEIA